MRFLRVFILIFMLGFTINANAFVMVLENQPVNTVMGKDWYETETGHFNSTLRFFKGNNNGCWFCGFYDTLFNTCNSIADRLYKPLSNNCILLLALFFAFFLLFKVAQSYISFGEIDPKQFFSELFKPFLGLIIAILVILNLGQLYTYAINPLAELAIGFSSDIVDSSTNTGAKGVGQFIQISSSASKGTFISNACVAGTTNYVSSSGIGFTADVNNAIQCFLQKISAAVIVNLAIGATFLRDSVTTHNQMFGLPRMQMLCLGGLIFIPTFMIFLTFPFKLVDALIRLIFVSALMPLWVALWVLPFTKGYASKAFQMFLYALVTFIALSVIMTMILIIMDSSFDSLEDASGFWRALKDDKTLDAMEKIDFGKKFIFMYVALMLLCFSLLGKVEAFVSHFVSGQNLGIGEGLGKAAIGFAVQAPMSKLVKPAVDKTIDLAGKGLGKGISKGAGAVTRKIFGTPSPAPTPAPTTAPTPPPGP